jgi:hypothetical protein
MPPRSSVRLLAPVLTAGLAAAQTVVFSTNFDGTLPAQIAPGVAQLTGVQGYAGYGPPGGQFAGNFLRSPTGNVVTLTLGNLPPHDAVRLDFLFAAIDSLDGTGNFPSGDFFAIRIDGSLWFRESFANALPSQIQSYVSPPGVELARRIDLGFSGPGSFYTDSAYWLGGDPQFQAIGHSASTLTVSFVIEGPGIQPLDDESWAIDNLTVSVFSSSTQGSATAYGTGCGPALAVLGAPRIGQTLNVFQSQIPAGGVFAGLAIGLSDQFFGAAPLPLSLAPFGAPGCSLLHDGAIDLGSPMQFFGTAATAAFQLPNDPSQVGFTFFLQGWALVPAANPFGIVTSNGLRVIVGQ